MVAVNEQGRRTVIYTRVSSQRQEDEGTSLVTQLDRCQRHARANGWNVLGEYSDTFTGSDLHERRQLAAVRELVRAKQVDIVLCYAVDRLSRNQAHIYILAEEMERHRVELAFVTESFEQSAVGKFLRSAKAFAAEVEHEKIRERTVRGRLKRVESGKLLPGGKPPYGYRWRDDTKGQLDLHEVEAPVIRRVFHDLASGKTLRQIVLGLYHDGIPSPTGRGHWHPSTLQEILHKPAYVGRAYGWGWRKAGVRPQTFDPSKAIALPSGTIPPIIDEETWNAVQTVLAHNKARAIRNAKNPEDALLRCGFVRCGYCGRTMRTQPRSDGGVDYVCKKRAYAPDACLGPSIKANKLDEAVWQRATSILKDPTLVAREVERLMSDGPVAADLEAAENALKEVGRQQANLARAIAAMADDSTLAPLVSELESLAIRSQQLQHERDRLLSQRESWQLGQVSVEQLGSWCQRVAQNLETLSFGDKRLALDALGFTVTVFRKNHEPRFVITAEIGADIVSSTT